MKNESPGPRVELCCVVAYNYIEAALNALETGGDYLDGRLAVKCETLVEQLTALLREAQTDMIRECKTIQ